MKKLAVLYVLMLIVCPLMGCSSESSVPTNNNTNIQEEQQTNSSSVSNVSYKEYIDYCESSLVPRMKEAYESVEILINDAREGNITEANEVYKEINSTCQEVMSYNQAPILAGDIDLAFKSAARYLDQSAYYYSNAALYKSLNDLASAAKDSELGKESFSLFSESYQSALMLIKDGPTT